MIRTRFRHSTAVAVNERSLVETLSLFLQAVVTSSLVESPSWIRGPKVVGRIGVAAGADVDVEAGLADRSERESRTFVADGKPTLDTRNCRTNRA